MFHPIFPLNIIIWLLLQLQGAVAWLLLLLLLLLWLMWYFCCGSAVVGTAVAGTAAAGTAYKSNCHLKLANFTTPDI